MVVVGVEIAMRPAVQVARGAPGHRAEALIGEPDAQAVARPVTVGDEHAFTQRAERAGEKTGGGARKTRAARLRGWTFFFQDGGRGVQGDRRSTIQSPDFSRR